MEFKNEIESVLERLKGIGYSRDVIEKALGYSENYIDQTLSKGGNKRFLKSLADFHERMLEKATVKPAKQNVLHTGDETTNTVHSLAHSVELSNEARLIEARNMDRLIALLEYKYGPRNGEAHDPSMPMPGEVGIKKNRQQVPVQRLVGKRKKE